MNKKMNKGYENENILSLFLYIDKKTKKWIYTDNVPILGIVKERK